MSDLNNNEDRFSFEESPIRTYPSSPTPHPTEDINRILSSEFQKRNTITGNFDTDPNSPQADTQSNHTSPISQQLINHMDMDRESIYSFDSVSTSGRLLDRLGLEDDDDDDNEDNVDHYETDSDTYTLTDKRESMTSIQTTGRLLDRLELDTRHKSIQQPPPPKQTNKILPIQPVNNLADIRGLKNKQNTQNSLSRREQLQPQPQSQPQLRSVVAQRQPPGQQQQQQQHHLQRINETPNLMQSVQRPIQKSQSGPIQNPQQAPAHLKHVPMNFVFRNTNNSTETIKSDMASLKKFETRKSVVPEIRSIDSNDEVPPPPPLPSITSTNTISKNSFTPSPARSTESLGRSSLDQSPILSPILQPSPTGNSLESNGGHQGFVELNDENSVIGLSSMKPIQKSNSMKPMNNRPSMVMRTPSAPSLRNTMSIETNDTFDNLQTDFKLRSRSDTTNTTFNNNLNDSIDSGSTIFSARSQNTILNKDNSSSTNGGGPNAESRTNYAMELRGLGNHREASYQLQIAANEPYNYPRAMFLYAMALKFGQGVKQNYRHSIKWLTKCILLSSLHITLANISVVLEKLNALTIEDLIKLIMKNLTNTVDKDPHKNGQDPLILYPIFKALTKNQIAKVINISKIKGDVVAASYHELGNYLINGWGVTNKDETNGINCLSKAGSMGYIDSMVQLGEIWCSKTKNRKKDLTKAAGWLRLSEIFGVKSIGNSWIYKEKYMN